MRILFIILALSCTKVFAQSSFGIAIGSSAYTTNFKPENVYEDYSVPKGIGLVFLAFYSHELNNKNDIIGNIALSRRQISYHQSFNNYESLVIFQYLDINPLIKYDIKGVDKKGAYLKYGFRLSSLLNAKLIKGDVDVKSVFNNTNFALNLGFGFSISKYSDLDFMFDYSLNNSLKSIDDTKIKSNIIGFTLLLNINLNEFIPSK